MRAAVLHEHGQPPVYGRHPVPRRAEEQALIRVTAAPVNPLDLLCASGVSYFGAPALPYVPGTQGVGVIEEADTFPAGQRVWFSGSAGMAPGDGTMAEYYVAEESAIVALPDSVSDDLVAALTWRGGLQAGEHVLVLGASGTVGQVGIQVARLHGAGRVIGACRDAQGRQRATELGADAVVDLTGEAPEIASRIAETSGGHVDLVLDPVWGQPAEAAMRVLSPHGRLVNLGSGAGQQANLSSATLRGGELSVLGYTNNGLSPEQKAAALAEILGHAAHGRIDTDRETLPLADVGAGWARYGKAPYRRVVMIPP
jgi:NADPH:quinone reductase-like Zn-dependent oxidoreductase